MRGRDMRAAVLALAVLMALCLLSPALAHGSHGFCPAEADCAICEGFALLERLFAMLVPFVAVWLIFARQACRRLLRCSGACFALTPVAKRVRMND